MLNKLSYKQRLALSSHPLAKRLLRLMEEKQSNLAVSADLTDKKALLELAEQVGPAICIYKTHIDIVQDFDGQFIVDLKRIANKHDFLLFEDRKFADIGQTVQHQFSSGIYQINRWADLINAHALPGPGVITGLKSARQSEEQGLLLIAEMSCKGHLLDKAYQQATLMMAEQHADFVVGFIAQHRLSDNPGILTLTPGVQVQCSGDALGQQYISPLQAIKEQGSDVIIVGRGIYQAEDIRLAAANYRDWGWQAYQERLR